MCLCKHKYSCNTSRESVSYTHLRAHETPEHLVCRLLLEKKKKYFFFFFLMIRRPPRSTLDRSSAASDVYKRQVCAYVNINTPVTRLENLESPNFDVLWLKIFLPSTTIILC